MLDGAGFAFFIAGALLLNITPGPDMAFTIASTARGGTRSGVAAALGVGAGSLVWAIATAAGLAAMLAASEHALTVIRMAGGVYLLYLAARTFTERTDARIPEGTRGLVKSFRAGVMTNLFNPKVGLFFLAFLPGFANAGNGDVAAQMLLLGAIFSVTGALVLMAVAMAAGAARARFVGSPGVQRVMKTLSAAMFGGLGIFLLLADDH
ncbi:LysE family translocator [Hyphococcus sp.]|uniref:LysE family translocator n=1 Tax=Hyphococcus sp. TaxID=2038636 RepID=UPI002081033C|nr:MAG: lysine transporter LysE [Marinicaulis sp.]